MFFLATTPLMKKIGTVYLLGLLKVLYTNCDMEKGNPKVNWMSKVHEEVKQGEKQVK